MGHGSMRAALIYQHATDARDRSIADAMSTHQADEEGDDGPAGAMVPVA
jgi:hypothetical protein